MCKLIAVSFFYLLFSCQIGNRINSIYDVNYLSHINNNEGGSRSVSVNMRNKSIVVLSTIRLIVELKLPNNKKVLKNFLYSDINLAVGSSQYFPFTISSYHDIETNKIYQGNKINEIKLVAAVIYNENEEELAKIFFPSIVL